MSLDVYLDVYLDELVTACEHCGAKLKDPTSVCVWSGNITHNLADMARAGGVYEAIWKPDTIGIKNAGHLVPELGEAINDMYARPDWYKKDNPKNGWGDFAGFLSFLERYRAACVEYYGAKIRVLG